MSKKKYSIKIKLVQILLVFFLIFLFYIGFNLDKNTKQLSVDNLFKLSLNITSKLHNLFSYSDNKITILATLISKEEENLAKYQQLIKVFAEDHKMKDVLTWSTIGWLTPENKAILDSSEKIINDPKTVNNRYYLDLAKQNPFSMIFGQTTIGYMSQVHVLPAGVGVYKNNKYLGTLSIGFEIARLKKEIDKLIPNQEYSYALFSKNNQERILSSSDPEGERLIYPSPEIASNSLKDRYLTAEIPNYPFVIVIKNNLYKFSLQQFLNLFREMIPNIAFIFALLSSLTYLFFKYFINPLILLTKITTNLTKKKKLDKEYEINCLEVNEVYNCLKKIDFHIQKEIELSTKLNKLNSELEHQVNVRTKELQSALSVKTEILNNLNHEIRTPLHGFSIISQELTANWNDFNEAKRRELAKYVSENVVRLEKLILNLLDLSNLSNNSIIINYNKHDFNLLLNDMIRECNSMYLKNKNVELIYSKVNEITIDCDQEKINQVLRNLILNAIKFCYNNTKITLKAEIVENQFLMFSIHNIGINIPKNEIEKIFMPFYQSSATNSLAGGTGLGLAICKNIIEAHKGKIWASHENGETIFSFKIPLNNTNSIETKDSNKNKVILIIDDEEICLVTMELLLRSTSYTLLKADSAMQGLEIITNQKVDLILLDIMMPEVTGIDFLNILKEKNINIPVIVQSGAANVENLTSNLKIKGLIAKPYKKEQILQLINNTLN